MQRLLPSFRTPLEHIERRLHGEGDGFCWSSLLCYLLSIEIKKLKEIDKAYFLIYNWQFYRYLNVS
jgi:hypothetical protein